MTINYSSVNQLLYVSTLLFLKKESFFRLQQLQAGWTKDNLCRRFCIENFCSPNQHWLKLRDCVCSRPGIVTEKYSTNNFLAPTFLSFLRFSAYDCVYTWVCTKKPRATAFGSSAKQFLQYPTAYSYRMFFFSKSLRHCSRAPAKCRYRWFFCAGGPGMEWEWANTGQESTLSNFVRWGKNLKLA